MVGGLKVAGRRQWRTRGGGGGGASGVWGDGRGRTDVCVAADLWRDKGGAQAAGIDGLLVRTGPCVSCFQND